MANENFSDEDFRELHRIAQTAALAAYPNPNRAGCPGTQTLREVANSRLPSDHPAYKHVATCSPCLREMLDMRQERVLSRIRKRYRIYRIGIAAVLVLAAAIGLRTSRNFGIRFQGWRIHIAPTNTSDGSQVAIIDKTIDLWNRDTLRGGDQPVPLEAVSLPAARVRVRVILPRLSDSGRYRIAVTQDKYGRDVLANSMGSALADGSREVVTVILDLRRATSGAYFLQTTRDQDEASYYYPLKVR